MDNVIINAIESNRNCFFKDMVISAGGNVYSSDEFTFTNCDTSIWGSAIFDLNFQTDKIDSGLNRMVNMINTGEAPRILITGAKSKPSDIGSYLLQSGFEKVWDAAGMAIKFDNEYSSFSIPSTYEIIEVDKDSLLYDWCRIVVISMFSGKEIDIEGFYKPLKELVIEDKVKCFACKVNGKIVASSALYLNDGIAGLYQIFTDPDLRNRGIGKQITIAPIIYAKKRGYKFVILQASRLGQIIYEHLGFKAYSTLVRYRFTG